jgi:phospholipid transport system substrate-binding protein
MLKRLKTHRLQWLAIMMLGFWSTQLVQLVAVPRTMAAEPDGVPAATDHEATTDSPQIVIEKFHASLLDIMKHAKEMGFQGRTEILDPLMKNTFDLEFMASKSVGRHWRQLSDEDKQRWVSIFSKFTTANYAGRFTGYTGEEFITLDVEDAPRDTQVVLTKIVVPSEDDVQLNYRMIERDGSWKVIDVFLNGTVSELALRRSEYSAALKSSGFDQLVASVETKIEDLKSKGQVDG